MRKAISSIIFVVLLFSSLSTLFVFVNITSLDNELDAYLGHTPYAPNIKIGSRSFVSKLMLKATERANQLNKMVYYLSGEVDLSTSPASSDSSDPELPPKLTESEASAISNLKGIKSSFSFDKSEAIFRWTVRAPSGKGWDIYPVPANYLQCLHPPLKEGRYFDEHDPLNVILIAEDFARILFGEQEVLGRNVTVSTHVGDTQFEIVGVLSRIPALYQGTTDVPFPAVIPYRKTYMAGNGATKYHVTNNEVWIVPEEGNEGRLLERIRVILGKEKFDSLVSSSRQEFEDSLGVRMRRERVASIVVSSVLAVLIGVLTIASFTYFDMVSRKRELGLKRSIGATIFQISWDYSLHLFALLSQSFFVSVVAIHLSLPLFMKYNGLGYFTSVHRSPTETFPLGLDFVSVSSSFILLLVVMLTVSTIFVYRNLQETPSRLLEPFADRQRKRLRIVALTTVIALSVTSIFASLSMMTMIRTTTDELARNVAASAVWIRSNASYSPFQNTLAKYDFEDYLAVRTALDGKALVGFRTAPPYMLTISQDMQGTFELRVSGATEDFPAIYSLELKEGRFIDDADVEKCVVGSTVAQSFSLVLGDSFMGKGVIGILENKGSLVDSTVYVPVAESIVAFGPAGPPSGLLLIQTFGDREETLTKALDILEQRHPDKSRGGILDVSQLVDAVVYSREGVYVLLSLFSLLSCLSALTYLSMTFLIEGIQRTREIGIKRAIGAERGFIQREFLWRELQIGLTALGIGVCVGSLASFVLAKSEGMTFSLQPRLLIGFVVSCCACLLLASYIPARYASSITPVEALHRE